MIRKMIIALCLIALMLPATEISAAESPKGTAYIQSLIELHRRGGEGAEEGIRQKLELLAAENPVQGEIWERIMEKWAWTEEMEMPGEILPDGLPEDDSLCIVVMGFRLEDDGRMKPELLQRLRVALDSARKYPQALVVCTGGATAKYAQVTEAEAMKNWLVEQGLEEARVVAETRANSSLDNARYTYRLLQESYPDVDTIALVTSEYHLPRCIMIFYAMGMYETPRDAYFLQGSAVCITGRTGNNEKQQTADNLLQIVWESEVPQWDLTQPEGEQTIPETSVQTLPPETVPETLPPLLPDPTQMDTEYTEPAAEETAPSAPAPTPGWVMPAMAGLLLMALVLAVLLLRIVTKRK